MCETWKCISCSVVLKAGVGHWSLAAHCWLICFGWGSNRLTTLLLLPSLLYVFPKFWARCVFTSATKATSPAGAGHLHHQMGGSEILTWSHPSCAFLKHPSLSCSLTYTCLDFCQPALLTQSPTADVETTALPKLFNQLSRLSLQILVIKSLSFRFLLVVLVVLLF